MQFDRHPDAVRIRIITMPRIAEGAVNRESEERVMRESGRHEDVFIKGIDIVLSKLLHVTRPPQLRMHF